MNFKDKRILNFVVIFVITILSFWWTFYMFHRDVYWQVIASVFVVRAVASFFVLKDYSVSWSRSSTVTFLKKIIVYFVAFVVYMSFWYSKIEVSFMLSELFLFIFMINFLMYSYKYYVNRKENNIKKDKVFVIYGAGEAGTKLQEEFAKTSYRLNSFIDDDRKLHNRNINGVRIIRKGGFVKNMSKGEKLDLLIIAMPSAHRSKIKDIYKDLGGYFKEIKVLPSINKILQDKSYNNQLKEISVEDLLARKPKELDRDSIADFIENKTILITGAGGSIGSEIARQCILYKAKKLILLDHSEFNLYKITNELQHSNIVSVMQSVVNKDKLDKIFEKYNPQIVIHAAAYKHVPLCEYNKDSAILNNVIGTKNTIDLSIEHEVEKFILISTDKAVRPTNVMGATKRICELYLQNVENKNTKVVAVRFGNVLGSSGSVIPLFREQIKNGGPITVTHPDITRYFMLIPEACELVLQSASIGDNGDIFILDMGEPTKIVDLANKMIELSGSDNIKIEFTGLRPGEKLYEELLLNDTDRPTKYESITVAKATKYDVKKLVEDINTLVKSDDKISSLKKIVVEFDHKRN